MRLPKRPKAVVIGISAADALSSTLSQFANVLSVPVEKDLGIDLMCELIESNSPTGMPFYVQCKGTDKAIEDKDSFSISIKVSTINYWLISKAPVFLILVDKERQKFYWAYPYEQIKKRLHKIQKKQTVVISIPMENCFSFVDKKISHQMDRIIKQFDSKELLMKSKEIEHGVTLEVEDMYQLYYKFKKLKSIEKSKLRDPKTKHLRYVRKVREQFSHFFITSDIRVWREFNNQLCFFLFKKIDHGNCYYIADVIILFNPDGSLDHIIQLTNNLWLDTKGDINDSFEPIVRHLNKIY